MKPRPVLALDIDGVVRVPDPAKVRAYLADNVVGGLLAEAGALLDAQEPAIERFVVRYERSAWPTLFHTPWSRAFERDGVHRDQVDDETFLVTPVGPWVRDLLDSGVDVVWASTWQEHANRYFAPLLGLPDLPVATESIARRGDEDSVEWKKRALTRFDGRPVYFVDDQAWGGRPSLAPFAQMAPNRLVGITAEQRAQVSAWLADPPQCEPLRLVDLDEIDLEF